MLTFSQLVRSIREEADLTQAEFAAKLGVSTVLISMIETDQKEVSKNFILKLAKALDVHPASITPFIFIDQEYPLTKVGQVNNWLISFGERMQRTLIASKAKRLR